MRFTPLFHLASLIKVTAAVAVIYFSSVSPLKKIASGMKTSLFKRNLAIYATVDYADQLNIEDVAISAVRLAGKIILKGSGSIELSSGTKSKIGTRDIVTECDINAQITIKDTISAAFPLHKFLGEEDVAPGREAAIKALYEKMDEENLWIIDPIDGTTNFAHGQPLCGVILSYASKGIISLHAHGEYRF